MNSKIRIMEWPEGNPPGPWGQFFRGATALRAMAKLSPTAKPLRRPRRSLRGLWEWCCREENWLRGLWKWRCLSFYLRIFP
jgi:hypothetical protein